MTTTEHRMTRTDVHRPATFDPADYDYVGCCDTHNEFYFFEFDFEKAREITGQPIVDEGGIPWAKHKQAARGQEKRSCDHCGNTNIIYYVFFAHRPSGEVIAVGMDCARRMQLGSRIEYEDALDRGARAARAEQAAARQAFATDPRGQMAEMILAEYRDDSGPRLEFFDSLASQLDEKGSLSDAQIDALIQAAERRAEREVKRAARDERLPDPAPAPVTDDRITVTGEIVSIKAQDGDYGESTKIVVADDTGFRVWGTLPSAIYGDVFGAVPGAESERDVMDAIMAGLAIRVKFDCKVRVSDRDENFCFAQRPTKASMLSAEQV